jgi:hypothetical protein
MQIPTDIGSDRVNIKQNDFCAVCTVDNGVTPAFDNRMNDGATLDYIEFNRGTVMRAIKRLKNNTASGPDGMAPIMDKNLAQSLAEPLALIFESFMPVGRIPDEWRRTIITPIYKSGLASDVSNYRPIAPTLCGMQNRGESYCL